MIVNQPITLNTRQIPLIVSLKLEFQKLTDWYLDNKISYDYYDKQIKKLHFLDKTASEFLLTTTLTQPVYDDYVECFKHYLNNQISRDYYVQTVNKFDLILSNTVSTNKLGNNVLFSIQNLYQFDTSETYYQSLWDKIQKKYDENEGFYLKNRVSKKYYEDVIQKLQGLQKIIKEIQSNDKWHIYEFVQNNTDYKNVDKFEPEAKIKPSSVILTVTKPISQINQSQPIKKISWFKRLCQKLFGQLYSQKETPEKTTSESKSEKLTDIINNTWNNLDYSHFNPLCTEKMEEIKNIINTIDFESNHNMNLLLEIKSTVCTVLPKLIETFNSVEDKELKDAENQNANTILEQSLVAIVNYFDTLKIEQKQENVQDMKVYSEFIQKKYQKAGM